MPLDERPTLPPGLRPLLEEGPADHVEGSCYDDEPDKYVEGQEANRHIAPLRSVLFCGGAQFLFRRTVFSGPALAARSFSRRSFSAPCSPGFGGDVPGIIGSTVIAILDPFLEKCEIKFLLVPEAQEVADQRAHGVGQQ